jgi:hypothetical protein
MRRRSLQESDQYTTEVVKAGLNEYRRTLADLIHKQVAEYAAVIGLPSATPQFEQDLVDALLWCHWMHLEATTRKHVSDIRKELLHVQREAVAAETSLSRLRDALNNLTPRCRELLDEHLETVAKIAVSLVTKQAPWFHALSAVADLAGILAATLKGADKGGRPKMLGFNTLVTVLVRAFERAKKKPAKVTWNNHSRRYGGEFMSLVEAVLPLAKGWAGTPERPLLYSNSLNARGKYIHELTRAGAGKSKRKR